MLENKKKVRQRPKEKTTAKKRTTEKNFQTTR